MAKRKDIKAVPVHCFPAVLDPDTEAVCDRCGTTDPDQPCVGGA